MASTSNYSILLDAEFNASQIKRNLEAALKNTDLKLNIDGSGARDAAGAVEDLGQAGEDAGLTYQAFNKILSTTIEIISSLVDEVFELDGAITEFKKVSDLTGESLDKYVNRLGELGKITARTKSEMTEAATEFKKSGFDEEDSAMLALVATELQNVADEELSAGEASNFLVSQIRAFNLEADDAAHILDSVNEVSNHFAVSSADLTKALPLVASALSVGNNEFEEMIGLT